MDFFTLYIYMYLFCSACRKQCVPHSVPKSLPRFLLAGGARDAHWTGTNEDASVASVKPIWGAKSTYCSQAVTPTFPRFDSW